MMLTVNVMKFPEPLIDTVFLLLFIYSIINILLLETFKRQP